jgi:hypothetical protein
MVFQNGQLLTFQEFQMKYDCRTNFLNFYQVINAIPKALLTKVHNPDNSLKENYLGMKHMYLKKKIYH